MIKLLQQVRNYCDRAVLLEKGAIMAEGDPDDVIRSYMSLWPAEAVASLAPVSS